MTHSGLHGSHALDQRQIDHILAEAKAKPNVLALMSPNEQVTGDLVNLLPDTPIIKTDKNGVDNRCMNYLHAVCVTLLLPIKIGFFSLCLK